MRAIAAAAAAAAAAAGYVLSLEPTLLPLHQTRHSGRGPSFSHDGRRLFRGRGGGSLLGGGYVSGQGAGAGLLCQHRLGKLRAHDAGRQGGENPPGMRREAAGLPAGGRGRRQAPGGHAGEAAQGGERRHRAAVRAHAHRGDFAARGPARGPSSFRLLPACRVLVVVVLLLASLSCLCRLPPHY